MTAYNIESVVIRIQVLASQPDFDMMTEWCSQETNVGYRCNLMVWAGRNESIEGFTGV